jgi:hypothetical protein
MDRRSAECAISGRIVVCDALNCACGFETQFRKYCGMRNEAEASGMRLPYVRIGPKLPLYSS